MKWALIHLDEVEESFWKDWEFLCSHCHYGNPILEPRFVKRLVEFFPQDVFAATARTVSGEIAAIILLYYKGKAVWQSYKPSQAQISLIVIRPDFEPNVSDLISQLPHYCIKLDFMSLDPREHQSLISVISDDLITPSANNITVEILGSFEDYWSQRNKKLKSNVKRYINRIQKEHAFTFNVRELPDDVSIGVSKYGMIESRGWKGQAGTALHPGNVQGQFYEKLLEDFNMTNSAKVFELLIDDEVVASRLCAHSESIIVMLKTTYEECFKRFAVGRVLLYLVIEYLYENKFTKVIDFYTNANRAQLEWSTAQRTIYSASCYCFGWMSALVPGIKKFKNKVLGL